VIVTIGRCYFLLQAFAITTAAKGAPRSTDEIATGRKVAAALSEKLVDAIRKMGIGAKNASYPELPYGYDLALRGQFLTIHGDNGTHSVSVGLAAGGSEVHAEVQIYQSSLLVEQFEEAAQKAPANAGASTTDGSAFEQFEEAARKAPANAGASIAGSSAAAPASEPFGTDVDAAASRTAAQLTKPLAAFFLRQGWISTAP
jgi:hypothetical protein